MNKILLSFTLTTIAGLSTIIGVLPIFFKEKNKLNIITYSLSFSSGIMTTISLISLIPESSNLLLDKFYTIPAFLICAIFIILGISISTTISNFVEKKINNTSLYKLGIISALVLILHNIPEGITTFISTNASETLGFKLAFAIALHNIPEGITIAVPVYYSTKSKKKAIIYTLIAGLSELLGALLAYIFLKDLISPLLLSITLAMTAGIMIDISIYEFLPTAFNTKKDKKIIYCFVLGIIIMYLSELILF